MMLTDEQWDKIKDLIPEPKRRRDGKGRPWASNRACFEGILWVLRTGARWRDMPSRYPSGVTCWRRLRDWEERDVWLDAWRALLGTLDRRGLLRWEETFLDGSFAPAKKGAKPSGKPSAARARSGWYWSTAKVFLWEHSSRLPRRTK
ncbi:MAG TPA: transposase [Terriglobales bacterium]|nr:transposase [Terriglobales bacterium]